MWGEHHWDVGSAEWVVNRKAHDHFIDRLLAAKVIGGVENEFVSRIYKGIDRDFFRNSPLLVGDYVEQRVTAATGQCKAGDPNMLGVVATDRI